MASIGKPFDNSVSEIPSWDWLWPADMAAQGCWQTWAGRASTWLAAQGVSARDALVLLPVGALLPMARQGWGQAVGGWLPRIETIASLAEGLAWQGRETAHLQDGNTGDAGDEAWPAALLDPVADRLLAAHQLGQQAWARQWAKRDRRGFDHALDQVVAATHTWLRRMQAMAPQARGAYGEAARGCLQGQHQAAGQAPGGRERLLLAWALEWALASAAQGLRGDAVYGLRPAAVVAVTAGAAIAPGTEVHWMLAAVDAWRQSGVPVWHTVAQPAGGAPGAGVRQEASLIACQDAEDEAQQAAAQVIVAVNAVREARAEAQSSLALVTPAAPIALIAQDRSLVRRVRALLEEAGARIADETGWRLSTMRTAAAVSRLIQASAPRASSDDLLDWLKSGWTAGPTEMSEGQMREATALLETWVRRHGLVVAWQLQRVKAADTAEDAPLQALSQHVPTGRAGMPAAALQLWQWAHDSLRVLRERWAGASRGVGTLGEWLDALQQALQATGVEAALANDPAGQATLAALRLDAESPAGSWPVVTRQARMDGAAFQRWVGAVMEATTYRPQPPADGVDVVITPMARAVLRPFAGIVLAGADERQLGALAPADGWLSTALREAMSLSTPVAQRAAQWDAFSLLMSRPGVVCLYHEMAGSEPLEPSPWLARWAQQTGGHWTKRADARRTRGLPAKPTLPPMPVLGAAKWAVPTQVTATAYEVMRQCPYRYFAISVLGLREQDELDEGLDRTDFGTWLHEVLQRFHTARQAQLAFTTEADDVQAWLAVAHEVTHARGLDLDGQRPYFLPFQVELGRLASAYVRWLREHEAEGWQVRDTECDAEQTLPLNDGSLLRLHGQLDRVDGRHADGGRQTLVLDYKTGSLDGVRRKAKDGLEDTQLAFYGLLAPAEGAVAAAYVHLDAACVQRIDHVDVMDSAQALAEGLRHDWAGMLAGQPLRALGQGSACAYCQARGLCRRDHWPAQAHEEASA